MKKNIIKALGILAASLAIASSCYAQIWISTTDTPSYYSEGSYDEQFNKCLATTFYIKEHSSTSIFYYPGYYKKPIRHELESDAVAYYQHGGLRQVQENIKEGHTEEDVLRVVRLEAAKLEHEELGPETKTAPEGTTTIYTWKWKNNHQKPQPISIWSKAWDKFIPHSFTTEGRFVRTTVEITKLKSGKKIITMNHFFERQKI